MKALAIRSILPPALILAAAVMISVSAGAATVIVEVRNNEFIPSEVTINPFDSVQWNRVEGFHTITSGTGSSDPDVGALFSTSVSQSTPTFSFAFTQAGLVPYFSVQGESFGMTGSVSVLPGGLGEVVPTPPDLLNTNATTDSATDDYPQVTTDSSGNWVAVWESYENLNGAGTDEDVFVARSTNNGATWTAPAHLNTNANTDSGQDDRPQVTTDMRGDWVAVWSSEENLNGAGTDRDIFVARSTNNGVTWTAPALLNTNAATDAGSDFRPQVTTDMSGNWVAVWYSVENLDGAGTDPDIFVARSTNNGATWTPPALLNTNATTDGRMDWRPQVTTDMSGNWVAVWQSTVNLGGAGADEDIFVARSTNNGATWTEVALLNTNATTDSRNDYDPQVTTDSNGNWVAVWGSGTDLGGAGEDSDIFVARSTDNGATWTEAALLNTNATTDSGDDRDPQVTTDSIGNWVAVWQGGPGAYLARSTDNGATWTAPGQFFDAGGAFEPQVTTDSNGNWVAVCSGWEDDYSGETDILVTRFSLLVGGVGEGEGEGEIAVDPLYILYSDQAIGDGPTAATTVTAANAGTTDLTISDVSKTGTGAPHFVITGDTGQAVLSPGQERLIGVAFDPYTVGDKSAYITIVSSDPTDPVVDVSLWGHAYLGPDIDVTPVSWAWPYQSITSAPALPGAVTITNTGGPGLSLSNVTLAGTNPGQFLITDDTGETSLGTSQSRVVDVAFNPSASGMKTASLRITSNDADEPTVNVSLTGTGFDPDLGYVSPVWVDARHTGTEMGTEAQPYNTLAEAANLVLTGGTVKLKQGACNEVIRIAKSMRLEAVGGTAVIGAAALNLTADP